jgi:hypothetical protein
MGQRAPNQDHDRGSDLQRLHRAKILSRRRDMKARANGKHLTKGFCLVEYVDPDVLRGPLDLSRVGEIPGYEG